MKLFHLSDLHIGLRLHDQDLNQDQRYIFDRIVDAAKAEKPDAILIAGDIYDKSVPSAEAVDTFDYLVSSLTAAVPEAELMMISGNHDSAQRVDVFRSVLERHKIHMIGLPPREQDEYIEKVTLTDEYGPVNFYLLPFVKPSMVRNIVGLDEKNNNLSYDAAVHKLIEREQVDTEQRNVLVSHQFYVPVGADAGDVERAENETFSVGNIDAVKADVLERFDYAALGHIHKPTRVGGEQYRYCGTPMACSVSEDGQDKGIIVVELGRKGDVQTRVLPLVPLHRVRKLEGTVEELLKQACDDYVWAVPLDGADSGNSDMQDRLQNAFPNLLGIQPKMAQGVDYQTELNLDENGNLDIFELCSSFLNNDLDEAEQDLLRDVINTVQGVQA